MPRGSVSFGSAVGEGLPEIEELSAAALRGLGAISYSSTYC